MVLQFIYLLGLLLLVVLVLRAVVRAPQAGLKPLSYEDVEGSFDLYVQRIESLFKNKLDGFIAVAQAVGQPHFVQVNVGGVIGQGTYQFTLPVTDWSRPYTKKIETETERMGNPASYHSDGPGGPDDPEQVLVVNFPDGEAHAEFARWVVFEVYGLPEDTRFRISGR